MTPDNNPNLSDVRAADPVRMADLPSSQSPEAQALLRQTMYDAMPAHASPSPGSFRSRLPLLAAVAAAVALVATTFAIVSPTNTPTALATVKAAAQEVAVADSGRIVTTFTITGSDGDETGTAAGSVEMLFNGDDLAISLDVDEVPSEFQDEDIDMLEGVETRIVDGVLYVRGGPAPDWVAFDVPAVLLSQIDSVDPRSVLSTIQTLIEAEEVGTETLDGEDVIVYRSEVDLDDPSLSASGWMAGLESRLDVEADGTIVVETWVDGSEQLRKIEVTGDLVEAQDGDGSAVFSISTVFNDLNAVDRIVAPEGVVPNSLLEGMFEGADN